MGGQTTIKKSIVATVTEPTVQVEPGGEDGPHGAVEVHYLAVEPGEHVLADGTRIEAGEIVILTGPSGSGKTTVLNLVGGLDVPSGGTVLLEGRDLAMMSRAQLSAMRRDRIGFVFQAYNLIPVLSALENVEFVMQLQGVATRERREKANAILQEVGLEGMENRRPAELSGGQQQRVAVARAVVSQPKLVLADEPTANLDSTSAGQLMDLFRELNENHGVTFLIATHDERVMRRARRLIRMQDGRVISDEPQPPAAG